MINKIFAQNFVRKMKQSMNLKVNVMDERGVIVASASKERVGDFHLCAYEIIQQNLPIMITRTPTRDLIGVNQPGVNLRLSSGGETIGVIGVSGDPDAITEIAKMVKLTFETMYEYEYKKNASMKGSNGIWNLSHVLLKEVPPNEYGIRKATVRMKYSDGCPRLPIYIPLNSEYRSTVIQHLLDSCSSLPVWHHQDIVLPVDQGILYMKACRQALKDQSIREYARQVTSALEKDFLSREDSDRQSLSYRFLIGPVQTSFLQFHRIYQDLLWLSLQSSDPSGFLFLQDHLTELLADRLPDGELEPLLSWQAQVIEENMEKDFFLDTAKQLLLADMKLDTAAANLHLHKNSVIARLKKIKELLNINPVSSPRDAALLQYLVIYMENRKGN